MSHHRWDGVAASAVLAADRGVCALVAMTAIGGVAYTLASIENREARGAHGGAGAVPPVSSLLPSPARHRPVRWHRRPALNPLHQRAPAPAATTGASAATPVVTAEPPPVVTHPHHVRRRRLSRRRR